MGLAQRNNSNWIRSRGLRVRRRPNTWQSPKGDKRTLTLVPSENVSQWPSIEEQCKTATADISPEYKRAIALLRSLRDVGEDEAQRQRETWQLLEHALDEDRYH